MAVGEAAFKCLIKPRMLRTLYDQGSIEVAPESEWERIREDEQVFLNADCFEGGVVPPADSDGINWHCDVCKAGAVHAADENLPTLPVVSGSPYTDDDPLPDFPEEAYAPGAAALTPTDNSDAAAGTLPEEWRIMRAVDLKALALKLTGKTVGTKNEAIAALEEYEHGQAA